MSEPVTTANPDGTYATHVSTGPIPDLLTLVREMREKYPRPTRLAILVNPADVLPDRSLSEAVQEALKPFKNLIVGLPLIVSQGAPVGVPLLLDQGQAMESPHAAFLREITKRTDEVLLGHASATGVSQGYGSKASQLEHDRIVGDRGLDAAIARVGKAFEEAGTALRRCAVQARKTAVAYRRAFGRKPRGLRRHIRRVKAEKRRRA